MYFVIDNSKRLKDLVERYKPSIVWSDGDWDQNSSYWKSTEFLAWLYNDSPVKDYVITNDRWGNDCRGKNGGYYTPYDGYNPGTLTSHKWEDSQTIGTAYCYNRNEHLAQMMNATQLIQLLATIVSTGGNLLLGKQACIITVTIVRHWAYERWKRSSAARRTIDTDRRLAESQRRRHLQYEAMEGTKRYSHWRRVVHFQRL
jgi:hypothetical protein